MSDRDQLDRGDESNPAQPGVPDPVPWARLLARAEEARRALLNMAEDQRAVEDRFRESEERYRALVDATADLVFVKDPELRYLMVNEANARFFRKTVAEVVGRSDAELMPDEAARHCRESDEQALRERRVVISLEEVDGRIYETRKFPVPLKGGRIGVGGLIRDVTDQRRAEETRREMELIVNHSPVIVWLWRAADGWPVEYVSANVSTWGYQVEDFTGGRVRYAAVIHPDDLPRVTEQVAREIREGREEFTQEYRILTAAGEVRWMYDRTWIRRDADGRITHYQGITADITDRKRAEDALRTSWAQLSNALKIASAGHWEYDVASDTFFFNDEFYHIFHTTAEQQGGYQMSSAEYARRFCLPEDIPVVAQEVRMAIESDDPSYNRQLEHRIRYDNGETGVITVRFFIVKDAGGRTVKTYGVNQDITERIKAEAVLRERVEELRRWHEATLGRELRILELKQEVNDLLQRAGQPVKYSLGEPDHGPAIT